MKWVIAAALAVPMVAAAITGPDLWYKLTFVGGALVILLLLALPERALVDSEPEEMPPFMTTDQVIAYYARQKARQDAALLKARR